MVRVPTVSQVTGSAPSRGHLSAAAGRQNLAQAIAYRAFLRQLQKQRGQTSSQMNQAAAQAQQIGNSVRQQREAILEKAAIGGAPAPQDMTYGGKSYTSTLAERPPVEATLPEYPDYPTAPNAPIYPKEPKGRLERRPRNIFGR